MAQPYDAVKANPDAADLLSLDHEVPAVEASYMTGFRTTWPISLREAVAAVLPEDKPCRCRPHADVGAARIQARRNRRGRTSGASWRSQVSLVVAALGQPVRARAPAPRRKVGAA